MLEGQEYFNARKKRYEVLLRYYESPSTVHFIHP